jgi:hypothetical protein
MFKGLVMGRIVRVHTAEGDHPAIVTRVLVPSQGLVDLQVFFTRNIEAWEEILYSVEGGGVLALAAERGVKDETTDYHRRRRYMFR